MRKDVIRQVLVVLATVAMIAVNYAATAIPINDVTTGEISDRFQVFFVPAGYVFAIWGLIYLGMIAFTVCQALSAQRKNPYLRRIGYLYVLSCAANVVWLLSWHYQVFPLTLVVMLGLLACLIAIYVSLRIGQVRVSAAERWAVHVPFSIYLGWITVATIANATSLLDYLRWDGWGISPEAWAVIMLLAATAIASTVSITRGDVAYALVIVWAFVGIAVKHPGTPSVSITAWVMAAVVALTLFIGVPRMRRRVGGESA